MRFLCLAYYDERKFESLSDAEIAAIGPECRPHDEALRRTGRLIEIGSLGPTKASVSLRPRAGKPVATDGPFAETKEQLGSYFVIEARDRDEAVEIASKHPAARLNEQLGWGIEVRPIEFCRVGSGEDEAER
jgi:hypothetical protein